MKNSNRRRFLSAGLSLAVATALFRFARKSHDSKLSKTKASGKYLTQDGRLVEIETENIPGRKRTASKDEVQTWINKDKPL